MDQLEDQDGITAYHGSPHDFEKFDLSKIGTGEGAQAFGHGLYFAENEGVARSYRDDLSAKQNLAIPASRQITDPLSPQELKAIKAANSAFSQALSIYSNGKSNVPAFRSFHDYYNFKNKVDDLDRAYQEKHGDQIKQNIQQMKENVISKGKSESEAEELLKDAGFYDSLSPHKKAYAEAAKEIAKHAKGHMYEVRINAHPDHFLDWDKPLAEQPHVVKAFAKIHAGDDPLLQDLLSGDQIPMEYFDLFPRSSGAQAYNTLAHNLGGSDKAAKALHEAGVKGVKYFDQRSRKEQEGSRNYVVFDDKLVNVKRKYADGGGVSV